MKKQERLLDGFQLALTNISLRNVVLQERFLPFWILYVIFRSLESIVRFNSQMLHKFDESRISLYNIIRFSIKSSCGIAKRGVLD